MSKKELCPCGTKENIETFENLNLNFINELDDKVKRFFGNSKLIIGRQKYKLRHYRWHIIISLVLLIILLALSILGESKTQTNSIPVLITSVPSVPSVPTIPK